MIAKVLPITKGHPQANVRECLLDIIELLHKNHNDISVNSAQNYCLVVCLQSLLNMDENPGIGFLMGALSYRFSAALFI